MDLNRPYTNTRPSCSDPCYNNPPNGGAIHPEFTDPGTFVGADSNATLDANDEIALMAFDAGGPRTTSYAPAGVDATSAVEVEITDPIDGGVGYVYLFKDKSGLDPAAGQDYVDYEFNLTNGPYKTGAYNPTGTGAGNGMNFGPRPETSFVQTDNYRRGFTDRWYDNELRILRGGATGVDILDRHDDQFDAADVSCIRDQQTFSIGEGAFIVNKNGPVRAIRDFLGANSGPHVQRQHIFYGGLEVINTFLRVHPIPGVVDFFDYSEAGVGLTYENGVMTATGIVSGTPSGGVTIDGQADAVTGVGAAGLPGFESVDGPQGALTMTQRLLTNNPDPGYRLNYRDGNVTNQDLCTGDDEELYGASGPQLNSAVNNTDEAGKLMWGGGQFSNLFYERSIYYEAPGQADGPRRLAELQAPLELDPQPVTLAEFRSVAFTSKRDGNSEIYSMGADGTAQKRLTAHPAFDGSPAFSADGKKIAFASNRDGNLEIYSMNANGAAKTRLTTNGADDSSPAFSPDATKVAFSSNRTGNGDIYVIEGSALTRLTTGGAVDSEPSWSPDGKKIAFSSNRTGNGDVYEIKADGSALRRLTASPARDSSPDWGPGGKIVFASKRTGNGDIYLNYGAARTRLTTNPAVDGEPAFLRNGQIAFASNRTGNGDIYVMNANGTAQTRLTTSAGADSAPDSP